MEQWSTIKNIRTQYKIKVNDYQLAENDICEHKRKVEAKKYK